MIKKRIAIAMLCFLLMSIDICVKAQSKNLKLVFIRHAEKSADGDNLNCQGMNRSMLLPAILYKKFGVPERVYLPFLKPGVVTKHLRMLETISPFAVKYNLPLTTTFDVDDTKGLGKALFREKGTILIVWEHKNIPAILRQLGVVMGSSDWPDSDYDSIWIVTFPKGKAVMSEDNEHLKPLAGCSF